MAEGGFDERDPLIPHDDDNDDEGAGDTTTPFEPGASSTLGTSAERHRMTTMTSPPERGSHTAETSFIEGDPDGRVLTGDNSKTTVANETLAQKYPEYGKKGKFLTLKVSKKDIYFGKVVVIGPKGGETLLFKADGETINPKLSKTDMNVLGKERSELIKENERELEETDRDDTENREIANNENE